MTHTKTCYCLNCQDTKKLGKNMFERIVEDARLLICGDCGIELYSEKVTVKKYKNKNKDYKSRT